MEPLTERVAGANPLRPFLDARGWVVLDGGLATALEAVGYTLDPDLWSAGLLIDAPDAIRAAHLAYLEAGADCITTASYQATVSGFVAKGLSEAEAESSIVRSSELALAARADFLRRRAGTPDEPRLVPLVAASVGPYGAYLADGSEYDGRYGLDAAALDEFHRRRFALLASSGADLLACETLPSGLEVEVLLGLLDEHEGAWAWMSFCCSDGSRLWDGTPVEDAARACGGHDRVAAVGVNCTDPRHVGELLARIAKVCDRPLLAYPNSGETYDAGSGRWSGPPTGWLEGVEAAVEQGARVVGGCCRVGPRGIRTLRGRLDDGDR